MSGLVRVAVLAPIPNALSYRIDASLHGHVAVGTVVVCPLAGRRVFGVVLGPHEGPTPSNIKSLRLPPGGLSLPTELARFVERMAEYYFAYPGEAMALALPPAERDAAASLKDPGLFDTPAEGLAVREDTWVIASEKSGEPDARARSRRALLIQLRSMGEAKLSDLRRSFASATNLVRTLEEEGFVRTEQRLRPDDPFFATQIARTAEPALTPEQTDAVREIAAAIDERSSQGFLLFGVTGAGKTEVYFDAVARTVAAGRSAIVLLPEIALTPQFVSRFRARFGDDLAVLHSQLTPRQKLAMWRRLRDGRVKVAIGARSALFAPLEHLGLIVVDEEHDSSFKQEEGVRYHARDMALLRAHMAGAVCVLGSATPSAESLQLAQSGKIELLRLRQRATNAAMPRVEIVDLRRVGAGPTGNKAISIPLHRALAETLERGEQSILFLNRRGFSPVLQCEACGVIRQCPHCSVSLTLHKSHGGELRCHYCDYREPVPTHCKSCGSADLGFDGLGTEKLEETIREAFPSARVARLDRDIGSGDKVDALMTKMRDREIDILVGTQMVTKGHDLPGVTLVGVLRADAVLSLPDFRAAERTFQLLVQVAGRAGRHDLPGRVIVQTYAPEHPAIVYARTHDVDKFLASALAERRELAYPPFTRMALVRIDGADEEAVVRAATRIASFCRENAAAGVKVLGPSAAPLARLRGRFRYRVMLRAKERAELRRILAALRRHLAEAKDGKNRVVIDIDPVSLL